MKNVNKLILLILLVGWNQLFLFGQHLKKMVVFDSTTNAPLAYASVRFLNKLEGAYTDQNGQISLSVSSADTLLVSSIGYKSIKICAKNDSVSLEPITYNLDEVKVIPFKRETCKVGLDDAKFVSFYKFSLNNEVALKIEIPTIFHSFKVQAVKFKCRHSNKYPLVRLHLYDQSSTGMPGIELLPKNIIINREIKRNGVVDLSNLNLILDKRVLFVGIEVIEVKSQNKTESANTQQSHANTFYLGVTFAQQQSSTFRRSLFSSDQEWVSDSRDLRQPGWSSNPGNLMVSLIIE